MASLDCPDCGDVFCRNHYHGHECGDPLESDTPEEQNETQTSIHPAVFGYALAGLVGITGLYYLILEAENVLYGAEGIEAIQTVMHLTVAAAFFSFATMILVASYISAR